MGPWRIDLTARDGVVAPTSAASMARAIAAAAEAAGAPSPASIGLILTDDAELAELNAAHLGKTGPTDVLSFPLLPPDAFPPHPGASTSRRGLGPRPFPGSPCPRVVGRTSGTSSSPSNGRCPGRRRVGVARPAMFAGRLRDELRLLVTHGTLHLCGWDHAEPAEEAAMRALETRLLAT